MESLPLQQLADETLQALVKANASKNYQKVFKTVSRNFIVYAREHDIDSFSIDHGIQFLEDHYSMSQKMSEKKWNGVYLRCINAMAEYQLTGTVDMYLVSTRKKYYFPEAFKDSADAYLSYREYIGISSKSIQISRLYLSRFFAFLNTKNVMSLDTVTVPIVLEFLKSLYEELFSKLPNPHYNRQSRLPSTYTEDEVRKTLDTIDMGNPCGIRDYAIILLIARLGLRSSDVANLRFSNIDWESDRIRLAFSHLIQNSDPEQLAHWYMNTFSGQEFISKEEKPVLMRSGIVWPAASLNMKSLSRSFPKSLDM